MSHPNVASALTDRLILVVGANRSGTTWLQQLLLGHPRVGGIERTETWIFSALADLWANAGGRAQPGLDAYMSPVRAAAILRRFCDRAFTRALEDKPGADYFVERTPAHAWYVDCMAALYPDAWVIHVIRDGRDVAQSVVEIAFATDSPRVAARQWREAVERIREDKPLFGRYREVRYEELLDDPVEGTSALLRWIGLPVDETATAEIARRAQERVSEWNTTGPVGPGKWQRLPVRAQQEIIEEAGPLLNDLGYV
jgi:hypothetical protein